jgi:hypothetical protein
MIASISVILLIFSEALVLFMIGRFLGLMPDEVARNPASLIAIFSITSIAFFLPKLVENISISWVRKAAFPVIIGLLALIICLRIEFAGDLYLFDFSWILRLIRAEADIGAHTVAFCVSSIVLLVAWLRATYNASNGIELENLPRVVAFPFLIVAILLAVSTVADVGTITIWSGIAYIALTLCSLAGAQLSRSGAEFGDVRAGGVTSIMLALTLAITIVLVLFSGFVFEILVDNLAPFFTGPFINAIGTVFYYALIVPIGWSMILIVDFGFWILSLLGGNEQEFLEIQLPAALDVPLGGSEVGENQGESAWNRWGRYAFGGGMLGIVVTIVVLVMILTMRWYKRHINEDDTTGNAERAGSLMEDLKSFASNFRFRTGSNKKASDFSGAIKLYLDLLDDASSRGLDRPASRTSSEFEPELVETYKDNFPKQITKLFEEERYASRHARLEDVNKARKIWEEFHSR